MSSDTLNMPWRIFLKNIETSIKIGIHDHEKKPQRLQVNVTMEGEYPCFSTNINDYYNYDVIKCYVTEEWPTRPHVLLLENLVVDLLDFIFSSNDSVEYANVSISKLDIFQQVEAVGVEAEWVREDYENYQPKDE